jgi:hypothetical protein
LGLVRDRRQCFLYEYPIRNNDPGYLPFSVCSLKVSAGIAEIIRTLLRVLVFETATIHCAHRQSVYVNNRDGSHQGATKLCLL